MSNAKRYIVFTFKVAIFLIIFSVIFSAISFAYSPNDSYVRRMVHEMYTEDSNIDVAVIGGSTVYRTIDPAILDEKLQLNTFNLGSSSQGLRAHYFLLKEFLNYHHPKYVFLNLDYFNVTGNNPSWEAAEIVGEQLVYDQLKPSIHKFEMLIGISDTKQLIPMAGKFFRYRNDYNINTAFENASAKINTGYLQYSDESSSSAIDKYVSKGYVATSLAFNKKNVGNLGSYDFKITQLSLPPNSKTYLKRIKELCDKNSVTFVCYSKPLLEALLVGMGSSNEASNILQKYCTEIGVPYIDFNKLKPQFWNISDDTLFYDGVHSNAKGADEFTSLFAQVVSDAMEGDFTPESYSKYFFDSVNEAMNGISRVSNLWLVIEPPPSKNEEIVMTANSYQNEGIVPEYQFYYRQDSNAEFSIAQPYSSKNTYEISETIGEYYEVRVLVRKVGSSEDYDQYQELIVEPGAKPGA